MLGVALLFFSGQSISQGSIKIAIIIDDLGNNYSVGKQLIDMPYQMTYAILPKRPYTVRLANLAAYHGKVPLLINEAIYQVKFEINLKGREDLAMFEGTLDLLSFPK